MVEKYRKEIDAPAMLEELEKEEWIALTQLLEKMAIDRGEKRGESGLLRNAEGKIVGRLTPRSRTRATLLRGQFAMAVWDKIWPEVRGKSMEEKEAAFWAATKKYRELGEVIDIGPLHWEKFPEKK